LDLARRAREQAEVDSRATEAEKQRTMDNYAAVQRELRETQLELQATERNRCELAGLLETAST